jgi:hypothetical protein
LSSSSSLSSSTFGSNTSASSSDWRLTPNTMQRQIDIAFSLLWPNPKGKSSKKLHSKSCNVLTRGNKSHYYVNLEITQTWIIHYLK